MNTQEIEAAYAARSAAIERLSKAKTITPDDITSLDRLGRFLVASELWQLCDNSAKSVLLNDQHAHVRSAAGIASRA